MSAQGRAATASARPTSPEHPYEAIGGAMRGASPARCGKNHARRPFLPDFIGMWHFPLTNDTTRRYKCGYGDFTGACSVDKT